MIKTNIKNIKSWLEHKLFGVPIAIETDKSVLIQEWWGYYYSTINNIRKELDKHGVANLEWYNPSLEHPFDKQLNVAYNKSDSKRICEINLTKTKHLMVKFCDSGVTDSYPFKHVIPEEAVKVIVQTILVLAGRGIQASKLNKTHN